MDGSKGIKSVHMYVWIQPFIIRARIYYLWFQDKAYLTKTLLSEGAPVKWQKVGIVKGSSGKVDNTEVGGWGWSNELFDENKESKEGEGEVTAAAASAAGYNGSAEVSRLFFSLIFQLIDLGCFYSHAIILIS